MRINNYSWIIVSLFIGSLPPFSLAQTGNSNYFTYHADIIRAEEKIFLHGKAADGLSLFKKTFDQFDFAFIDDCIEAFQLALHFEKEEYAMAFIKKAIKNGFDIQFLGLLNLGCVCNTYKDYRKPVEVYEPFIRKNRDELLAFQEKCKPKYLSRIDKDLLLELMERFTMDELFKNPIPELGMTTNEQKRAWRKITEENIRFIDSLAGLGIFIGERNLGLYSDQLMTDLGIPNMDSIQRKFKLKYKVPLSTDVPIISDLQMFQGQIDFVIQYHNPASYEILSKHKVKAVALGYWHPREFARLRKDYQNRQQINLDYYPYFEPTTREIKNADIINKIRQQHNMCSIELDNAKHEFAHKNNLHLYFGFFNGTK